MTGWRIGWVITSGPGGKAFIDGLIKLQGQTVTAVPGFVLAGVRAALTECQSDLDGFKKQFAERAEVMYSSLKAIPGLKLAKPEGAFGRARASSDTPAYLSNLARRGVYAIHGTADDNVPVTEGRTLVAQVRAFTDDVELYEQPGAGHWWDGDASAGADWSSKRCAPTRPETTCAPSTGASVPARGAPTRGCSVRSGNGPCTCCWTSAIPCSSAHAAR
jgi:hypothetical protein